MINDDGAKKLGKKMTDQYPLVVFAMAKSMIQVGSGFEISSLAVTTVRSEGCEIRVTMCRGDLCEMKKIFYTFRTPLESLDELTDRFMTDVRNHVCTPNPLWMVTDPIAVVILVTCGLLGYGAYLGVDGMVDSFGQSQWLETIIVAIFGTTRKCSYLVCGSFWFAIVAHLFEAILAVYYASISLQLGVVPSSLWGVMVFLVGYPIFSRIQELKSKQRSYAKSK